MTKLKDIREFIHNVKTVTDDKELYDIGEELAKEYSQEDLLIEWRKWIHTDAKVANAIACAIVIHVTK